MKTASAQNFAGFIFQEKPNDSIPEVDVSWDLQKLKNGVEQQKTEIKPLPKETLGFVIAFLETQGENDKRAIRFELNYDNTICHIDLIEASEYMKKIQKIEGNYIYIYNENNSYISNLEGEIMIPNNGKIRSLIIEGKKNGKTKEEVLNEYKRKGQQYINNVFITLANYY